MLAALAKHRKKRRNTVQKLLTNTLNTLNKITKITALILALKPTTTMTQATNPIKLTSTRQKVHLPARMKPMKSKIKSTRPASCTYILRSFSSSCGRPAGMYFLRTHESEMTSNKPPMTLRLRRKKLRSKRSPYPRACVMTTPSNPPTAYSLCLRVMTMIEAASMTTTLTMRKICVIPQGTVHH